MHTLYLGESVKFPDPQVPPAKLLFPHKNSVPPPTFYFCASLASRKPSRKKIDKTTNEKKKTCIFFEPSKHITVHLITFQLPSVR